MLFVLRPRRSTTHFWCHVYKFLPTVFAIHPVTRTHAHRQFMQPLLLVVNAQKFSTFCKWQLWYNEMYFQIGVMLLKLPFITRGNLTTAISNTNHLTVIYIYILQQVQIRCAMTDMRCNIHSTLWVKKTCHYTFVCNFAKCWQIFKIHSLTDSVVNLQ